MKVCVVICSMAALCSLWWKSARGTGYWLKLESGAGFSSEYSTKVLLKHKPICIIANGNGSFFPSKRLKEPEDFTAAASSCVTVVVALQTVESIEGADDFTTPSYPPAKIVQLPDGMS